MSKTLTLRLTDTAEGDLAEIWAYIATEASETTATRLIDAIGETLGVLQHSPLIGSKRDQFASGLRVFFHTPYAIYYLPDQTELIVVRVLHGSRDTAAIAEQGGFKQ